ncbi:MAG: glycoside hydrolase family 3 N-terminal domain-containing protein [Trueperaceae bacterium]
MISFRGHEAPAWVLDALHSGAVGAVCLFNFNVASAQQLRELNLSLMAAAAEGGHPPPLIGIDQEGGQLQAVSHGATELPGNMALGAVGSEELARRTGAVLGRELLALGVNMNFAPVLDLATQPDNDAMGVRVFGTAPALAARLGAALIEGMQQEGVLATAKHFPGHGDTHLDSHLAAPVINAELHLLEARELEPFAAAMRAGVAAVMTCHAYYPALDPDNVATHSAKILKDLLRDRLGFGGLVVTDALDMSGVGSMPDLERAVRAVRAGADLAMLGHLPDQEGLVRRMVELGQGASAERVMAVRRRLPAALPPLSALATPEHLAVARETAEAAITALRGSPCLRSTERVLLIGVEAGDLTPAETAAGSKLLLGEQLRARVGDLQELTLRRGAPQGEVEALLQRALEWRAGGAGEVVVASVNAASDPAQLELLARLTQAGLDPLLVALRAPFDVVAASFVPRAVASYGRRAVQTEAVARVLCGEIPAAGSAPVTLPEGATAGPETSGPVGAGEGG